MLTLVSEWHLQGHQWNDIVLSLAYKYLCPWCNRTECSKQMAFIFTFMFYQFWKVKNIMVITYADVHCV